MSSAYQRFIDFFDLVGPQQLDGLNASYFDPMSAQERAQAYDYLLTRVQTGGSDESINGLFLADERRALIDATDLLQAGRLRPKAEILAAWNTFRLTEDVTPAYQRFLDFFQLAGKQRLDGLDASYFESMTAGERRQAYDLLWSKVEKGGTDESINGLFLADETRAVVEVPPLLDAGRLRPHAEVLAAWNIYRLTKDIAMMAHFARRLSDESADVRGSAAYYAPAASPTHSLVKGLQGMVLTETERLPLIHAVNKLLECHGITETSVDRKSYLHIYRGLRSDDTQTKIATIDLLQQRYPVAFVDD